MRTLSGRVVVAVVAVACAVSWRTFAQTKPAEPPAGPTVEATGEAKRVLHDIEGYRSWPKFSRYEKGPKQSKGHGGTFVVAHYNEVAARAVRDSASGFSDGSVLVKENRPQADAEPASLTTMAKLNGAWFWVKSTPDGKVFTAKGKPLAGAVQGCIGCHVQAPRDMVFSE